MMMENNEIKTSVLMTVYNDGCRLLKESIESVLKQSMNCDQFVIVNDGSTDNSEDIILDYKNKYKNICFINRKENKGRIYSLNEGLESCTGDLIFINDADDFSDYNRIYNTVNFYKTIKNKKNVGAIGGKGYLKYPDHSKKYYRFLTFGKMPIMKFQIYYGMPFIHSSCAYSKNALKDVGGFSTELSSCIDYFTIVRLATRYDIYGINGYMTTRNMDGNNFFIQNKIQKNYQDNLYYIESWMSKYYPKAKLYKSMKCIVKFVLGKE